jgi:exonuclease SbcD
VVSLSREEGYSTAVESQGMSGKQIRQKDPVALLGDFYESVAKEALTAQQMSWAKETLKIANDGGTKS